MSRLKLICLAATLLQLNFIVAKQSLPTTGQPIASIAPNGPTETDSMDANTFIKLSRKEFETYIGHDLTKQERRAFRKAKRELRRQMALEGKRKWWIGIVIGGGIILAGLVMVFMGTIKTSECENPPYCEDGDTEKAIGNGVMIGGALVVLASIVGAVTSKKAKEKQ